MEIYYMKDVLNFLKFVIYSAACLVVIMAWVPIFLIIFVFKLLQIFQNFVISKRGAGHVLDDADAGFLFVNHIDCMMNFVAHLDGDADISDMKKIIIERAINKDEQSYRRLRQKITLSFGRYVWVDEDNFNIDDHVRLFHKDISSIEELQDIFSNFVSTPISEELSPWEFLVIRIKSEKPQVALAARIHHSICDGFGTVGLFASLVDNETKRLKIDRTPPTTLQKLVSWSTMWLTGPLFITWLTLCPSSNPFNRTQNSPIKKRISWTKGISMEKVKEVKRATGATITDVIMASLAGSLRNYLISKGHDGLKDFHILLSVNLRSIEDFNKTVFPLENKSGAFVSYLPVEIPTAKRRLLEVKKRLGGIRSGSGWRFMSVFFNEILGLFPNFLGGRMMGQQQDKVCLMLGNIPGPQEPLRICDKEIKKILAFAPMVAASSLTVTAVSYSGELRIGVLSDKKAINSPEELTDLFDTEFQQICKEVLNE